MMRCSCLVYAIVLVSLCACSPTPETVAKDMKLKTDTNLKIDNPFREQIRAAVIESASRPEGFVILGENEMTYIQTAANNYRFVVEYQEGTLAKHYRAKGTLSSDEVVELFFSYCARGHEWKSAVIWESAPIESHPWWKFW